MLYAAPLLLAKAQADLHWFLLNVAPWLIASAIPSLIAGLSKSPRYVGLVSYLKVTMQVLGWAAHKDAEGTFKLPLTGWKGFVELAPKPDAGEPPVIVGPPPPAIPPPGAALLLLLCVGTASCGAAGKQFLVDMESCATGAVPGALSDTVQQAIQSMEGNAGAQSWEDFSKGELVRYGIDAGICVVQAAYHALSQSLGQKGQIDPSIVKGRERASEWLEAHNVKPIVKP
jgi:hypothetical protein